MSQKIAVIAGVLLLLLSRLGLDVWMSRVQDPGAPAAAAARLDKAPMTAGPWQGQALPPLDPDDVKQARLSGYLWRRYRNSMTGEALSVLLVCGRPGPISVHTPDACYGGAGYDMDGQPVRCSLPTASGSKPATFWTARFRKTGAPVPQDLRIYWSWNAAGTWEAPANPRLAFAGVPALYKLYIVCDLPAGAQEGKDPGIEFLTDFLPELQKALGAAGTDPR